MPRLILLVDDNDINLKILNNTVSRDYAVLMARSGEEALELLSQKKGEISAVLLDIILPGIDGYAVLRRMRSDDDLEQIPVIMVTGLEDDASRVKAISLGANDFVQKPFTPEIILHCLKNNITLHETIKTVNILQRDHLTGLHSREVFFDKVREMVAAHEPEYYIMACMDVDHFKVINDQYGTHKGDEVLRYLADTFKAGFEPNGGLVCRVSADNFAVLYPLSFVNSPEIEEIRRLATAVPGILSPLAFSIGRYLVDDISMSPSAMYDRAILAADSVKGRYHKQIAFYDEDLRKRLLDEQGIVNEMKAAIDSRQFEVWYQPQHNHSTGALIGAEALVRWNHPTKGLISPSVFVPIFEKNGFIYELDKYVWEEVCLFLRQGIDNGYSPLPISVNISRYDILCPDFAQVIEGLLRKYDLPVTLLRLEIAESAFAESTKEIVTVVKQLSDCGFTLEIDNFGSGSSSLNTLKSVPAHIVKLDMRFFDDDDGTGRSGNIIESVVRMVDWLGMSVIAEGVEQREFADFLQSIGCNYIQGYLYSKPITEADYVKLAKKNTKEEKLITVKTVETLDNSAFWNPHSMDTLIFNSYVGGALIFEYRNGATKVLRINDRYLEELGNGVTRADIFEHQPFEYMDNANIEIVLNSIHKAIETGKEVTFETYTTRLYGVEGTRCVRSTLRVIAKAGNRYLLYNVIINLTEQREAERKERELATQLSAIMRGIGGGVSAAIVTSESIRYIYKNKKYTEQLGYTPEQFDKEVPDAFMLIHPDDRKRVAREASQVTIENHTLSIIYRIIRRDGVQRWIRSNIVIVHLPEVGDDPIQLTVSIDITDQVEVMQGERRVSERMKAVMDNVDVGITAAVVNGMDVRLLMVNNRYYAIYGYTKEQYESEVVSPFSLILDEDRQKVIHEVNKLKEVKDSTVVEFRSIRRDGSVVWLRTAISLARFSDEDELVQLAIIRDITREKQAEQDLQFATISTKTLLDDTPVGFARISISPDGNRIPVYFNNKMCELMQMSRDEVVTLYAHNSLAGVHPDDIPSVNKAVKRMTMNGEASNYRYRLRHAKNGYIWVSVFGRVTSNERGERFLNLYYTDASEEIRAEERLRELIDNLPCGAALLEYDGEKISVIHLNKRYLELAQRERGGFSPKSINDAIHPDDMELMEIEFAAAIAEKRDAVCDLRIALGTGGYRPFHVVWRIVPKGDGKYSAYLSLVPIDENVMSFSESLPFVLSAIMESSTDLSFAKDTCYRYLCASRAFANMVGIANERSLIGKTDYDIFPTALADKFRRDDEELMHFGKPMIDMIEEIKSTDGKPHFSKTSKYIIRDTLGNAIGFYGVGRDITQSLETESQLQLLTNNIPGAIATYEACAGAIDKIRLTYFSDGFIRLFGYTREEYEKIAAENPFCLVVEECLPELMKQAKALMTEGKPVDCIYRVQTRDGNYKWINLKGELAPRHGEKMTLNAVFFDVTAQQEALEQLRISEEDNRLAMEHSGSLLCRFYVKERMAVIPPEPAKRLKMPERIYDIPDGPIREGIIAPESVQDYIDLYESIAGGTSSGTAVFKEKSHDKWRWVEARYSTVFSRDGKPVHAVLSFLDITERMEKEVVYSKWQQSLKTRNEQSYSLFRYNLSKKEVYGDVEGTLISRDYIEGEKSFSDITEAYTKERVFPDDRARYLEFMNPDSMLSSYSRGRRANFLEYREGSDVNKIRWVSLSAEMVENPNSKDVELYLMYEDITESKLVELHTKEQAETDPLTGLLNRTTFVSRTEEMLLNLKPDSCHALLMVDVDKFKEVNDTYGHEFGDQVLVDVANVLSYVTRRSDVVGRLGGDEFVVFLNDIHCDSGAATMAERICENVRKSLSIKITISMGIAISPRDGVDFDTLYKNADEALYNVKRGGKDGYAFYCGD